MYVAGERELTRHKKLINRNSELYWILVSTIPWLDRRMVTIPKKDFLHGDRINAPIRYVTKYVLFQYTNREGKELTVSSCEPYQRYASISLKKSTIPPQ